MSGKLVIRAAHMEDSGTIFTLMREFAAYADMTENFLTDQQTIETEIFEKQVAKALIAEVDGHPIGFALFYDTFSSFAGKRGMFMEDLYVTPLFRGYGYGKEMIKVVKEIAKEGGYHSVEWRCLKWNQKAQNFYESLGATIQDQSVQFKLSVGDREYTTV